MIGQKLGPYNIIEEIGKGGMATVFRAHQPSIDRDVAVKLIRTRIADDPTAIQRFQREARLIARLEHPHILPVYDFDGSHEPPYIVMRYLEGGTLKEVMAQGKLPLAEVTYLLRQVCSAMDYAHRQGIVHRDLKPSNILIDREGNAFVMDFGIARMADMGEKQITETGAIVGTPDYMAPEQIQGSNMVDQRADVYSIGIIAYEMLSDSFPFPKVDAMAMMYHHLKEEPASITEKAPDLPDAVEDVIDKVLEKDPELRYSSAAEFAEALVKALGGTVSASPVTLRAAAGTSVIKRVGGMKDGGTDSRSTPSEQNKTVTALYANAVDYSGLVDELAGSESAHRAIRALWDTCEEIIKRYEGTVFTRTDNELFAIWGSDAAQEDDAEQAIFAAIAMRDALLKLGAPFFDEEADEELPLNIGLHSGMALIAPQGETNTFSASGSTINTAYRLMQNAYGQIRITHDVYRQVRGVFDVFEDEPLKMRGQKDKIVTYRVLNAKARAFRVKTRGVEGIETQMIGRVAELKYIQDAFLNAVEDEETQAVTIISEAGLGKSRLLYEFREWADLQTETYWVFQGRATANMSDRPYALMRDMLSFRFEIQDSDAPEVVREKLEAGVANITGKANPEIAHFVGHLVGFDQSDSPYIRGIVSDAEQVSNRGLQLFIRMLQATMEQNPIVMLLEDIHHADNPSLDLINRLITSDSEMPLLLVCNARPSLLIRRPDWGTGQSFHRRVELYPLTKRESRDLISEILQKVADIPKDFRDLLVERSEGNPFYTEELIKMLIDDRVILRENDEQWSIEESRLEGLDVPNTLNGLLEARLDTLLAPEKLTLQRAAVVGRFFYDSALKTIDAADEYHIQDLEKVLENLVEREFIYRRDTSAFEGHSEYIFASNMLRDAIEYALLERQIKAYNKAAAEWLVKIADNRVDEYLAHIAEYYEKAGANELAAQYLLRAAEKANNISAYTDAQDILERALNLVGENSPQRARIEIQLSEILSRTASLDEAKPHAELALKLARQINDAGLLAEALYQNSDLASTNGDLSDALSYLEEALPLAESGDNTHVLVRVIIGISAAYGRMLNRDKSVSFAEQALEIARKTEDENLELMAISQTGFAYLTDYTNTEDMNHAETLYKESVVLARKLGNRAREAGSLGNLGFIETARFEQTKDKAALQSAIEYSSAAMRISREIGSLNSLVVQLGNLSENYMILGELEQAYSMLVESIQIAKQLGATYWLMAQVSAIARLRIVEGKMDEGLAILGTYHYHPSSIEAGQEQTIQIMPMVQEKLSDAEIEEKMLKGKDKDFMAILDAFLEENG